MKNLAILALCLFSLSTMAIDCFQLKEQPSVLRVLSAPKIVCVSHLLANGKSLTGKLYIDGEMSELKAPIRITQNLGTHFESATALIYSENSGARYCEEIEMLALNLNIVLDYDGSLTGIDKLEGMAGYSPDICHTQAKPETIQYSQF